MIKTHELRLGNIVSVNKGFEMTVVAIFKDTVYLDFEGNQGDVWEEKEEDIFPVPLTGEWFDKFGYELFPWGYVKEGSPLIAFSLTPKEKYWVELGNGFRIYLPYVYTLQNFIQLTGQELTIKK